MLLNIINQKVINLVVVGVVTYVALFILWDIGLFNFNLSKEAKISARTKIIDFYKKINVGDSKQTVNDILPEHPYNSHVSGVSYEYVHFMKYAGYSLFIQTPYEWETSSWSLVTEFNGNDRVQFVGIRFIGKNHHHDRNYYPDRKYRPACAPLDKGVPQADMLKQYKNMECMPEIVSVLTQ